MKDIERIRQMTPSDLAGLGLEGVAYVRPVTAEGRTGFVICAADGTEIGMAPTRDLAFATIRQNDLEPVSVH
ncbi:MAG: DUF1150 family protein [Dongiaceae bacterium]